MFKVFDFKTGSDLGFQKVIKIEKFFQDFYCFVDNQLYIEVEREEVIS